MSKSEKCLICIEQLSNKSCIAKHYKVVCPQCHYIACSSCYKKYILSSINDPTCMNCRHPFNNEFLHNNFTKVWINSEFKQHQMNKYLSIEKALIPETQKYYNREKLIININEKISHLHIVMNQYQNHRENIRVADIDLTIDSIDIDYLNNIFHHNVGKQKTKPKITQYKKCPTDECKGFLDSKNHCGCCNTSYCKKCNMSILTNLVAVQSNDSNKQIDLTENSDNETNDIPNTSNSSPIMNLNEIEQSVSKSQNAQLVQTEIQEKQDKIKMEHVCNQDDIETYKLLSKNTKQCPKCSMAIFKISGCNVMFCVSCHTGFEWDSLTIITNNIHNPHYYEWQHNRATQERAQPALPDTRDLCANQLYSYDELYIVLNDIKRKQYENYCLTVQHNASITDTMEEFINQHNKTSETEHTSKIQTVIQNIPEPIILESYEKDMDVLFKKIKIENIKV